MIGVMGHAEMCASLECGITRVLFKIFNEWSTSNYYCLNSSNNNH